MRLVVSAPDILGAGLSRVRHAEKVRLSVVIDYCILGAFQPYGRFSELTEIARPNIVYLFLFKTIGYAHLYGSGFLGQLEKEFSQKNATFFKNEKGGFDDLIQRRRFHRPFP